MVLLEKRDERGDPQGFLATTILLGPSAEANHYSYTLTLEGNGRLLLWRDIPETVSRSVLEIIRDQRGLAVKANMLQQLLTNDRDHLRIKVVIRRNEPGSPMPPTVDPERSGSVPEVRPYLVVWPFVDDVVDLTSNPPSPSAANHSNDTPRSPLRPYTKCPPLGKPL